MFNGKLGEKIREGIAQRRSEETTAPAEASTEEASRSADNNRRYWKEDGTLSAEPTVYGLLLTINENVQRIADSVEKLAERGYDAGLKAAEKDDE